MNYELLGILLMVVIQALYFAHKLGKFEEKLNTIEKNKISIMTLSQGLLCLKVISKYCTNKIK